MFLGHFGGFKIVENAFMCETIEKSVKRTWKERLFTIPFRPFQAFKKVSLTVPSNEILVDTERCIITLHPCMKDSLLKALEKKRQ